jgi:hypothetical protein
VKLRVWHTDAVVDPDTPKQQTSNQEDGDMGFFDNLKEALGGDRDGETTTAAAETAARHADRNAPEESEHGAQVTTGGKHAARE